MEAALQQILSALCPRTFITVAPHGTEAPFMVWQQTGGLDVSFLDNSSAKRNARVQISIWAKTPLEAASLRDQVESVLRPLESPICRPTAAHHMTYERDTELHGVQQVWEIWV